jgi:hypothetical protein
MARTTNRNPRAIGTGAALQATLQASLTALDSRTLPHGVVFNGLDQINQAIGDVAATSAVLDEIIANMSDGDAKHEAIDNLFRHLQADLTTLQRANAEARALIRKGGARILGGVPSKIDAPIV